MDIWNKRIENFSKITIGSFNNYVVYSKVIQLILAKSGIEMETLFSTFSTEYCNRNSEVNNLRLN